MSIYFILSLYEKEGMLMVVVLGIVINFRMVVNRGFQKVWRLVLDLVALPNKLKSGPNLVQAQF